MRARMSGVTFIEFLLARIAEDEAWLPAQLFAETAVAECKMKRRIVALHRAETTAGLTVCTCCAGGGGFGVDWPCETLLLLAEVYADHVGYQQEWRP